MYLVSNISASNMTLLSMTGRKKIKQEPEHEGELISTLAVGTDVSNLSCRFCGRSWFPSRQSFIKHFHKCSVTPVAESQSCEVCHATYKKAITLTRHRREVHNIHSQSLLHVLVYKGVWGVERIVKIIFLFFKV